MCDYAGIRHPAFTGRSLRPVIENPKSDWREYLVTELLPDPDDVKMLGRMVRSNRWKYCAFNRGTTRELLFDMDADPGEKQNLAGNPSVRDVLERHRLWLKKWMTTTNDAFARE
jgi:choline-sulfatase